METNVLDKINYLMTNQWVLTVKLVSGQMIVRCAFFTTIDDIKKITITPKPIFVKKKAKM